MNSFWRGYLVGAFNALVLAAAAWLLFLPPVAMLQHLDRPTGAASIAQRFGVTVERSLPFTCDGDLGCWVRATPSVIYVGPDVEPGLLDSVILHELGHALVARAGGDGNDECAAEAIAAALGATVTFYSCS